MGFGGEIKKAGEGPFPDEAGNEIPVVDVSLDEVEAGIPVGAGEIGAVAGLGEGIENGEVFEIAAREELSGQAGADETGSASEKDRAKRTHRDF